MESASNSGTRVGYTRVSTVAQTLDQQNTALAAAGRMVIGVLASMAEFERELIKERTALKRAVSRANGTKFGRRTKVADPVHVATAQTDEGRWAHRTGCRQVPRRQPSDPLSVPRRRSRVAPGGGRPRRFTPGGGTDQPAHPRRG